jgi:5'-3' exonuclease
MIPLFKTTQKTLLIDFSNLVFRTALVKQYEGGFGHVKRFYSTLSSIQKKFPSYSLIFVFDSRTGKEKRKKLFSDYNANRKSYSDRKVEMGFNPIVDASKLIKNLNCEICVPLEAEADDAIAALCKKLPGIKCIVTTDKDLWQLMSNTITVYNKEIVSIQDILKAFRIVNPKVIPLIKTLYGDPSDNIPGIGIRWKNIEEVLKECVTLEDLFTKIDKISNKKTIECLLSNKDHLEKIYKIVCLDADCKYVLKKFNGDKEKLSKILSTL